ncbi:MAG: hypothetical protein HQ521_01080 [Bacteroidetes bacterium]|nr:hypothetical protein [Bacteroidota bacterium]
MFLNGYVGLEVAKTIKKSKDEVLIVFHCCDIQFEQNLRKVFNDPDLSILNWEKSKLEDIEENFIRGPADFTITVYWPYLLRGNELNYAKDSVNFHPALLPINRGWYPHVHSIIDGSPLGVTLHRIDIGADTGDIWVQKKVKMYDTEVASDIHMRLQNEMIQLFNEKWDKIRRHKLVPFAQDPSKAVYHKKLDVDKYDIIELDAPSTPRTILNQLRARTFGEKGYAYFYNNDGRKIFVSIKFSVENTTV